jgi:mannose-6-phosphate isomerase-like protein (cupin superfamily)
MEQWRGRLGYGVTICQLPERPLETYCQLGGMGRIDNSLWSNGFHLKSPAAPLPVWRCIEHVCMYPGSVYHGMEYAYSAVGEHTHTETEEIYLILEGTAQMRINGQERAVQAYDLITSPIGTTHTIINNSPDAVRFLVVELFPGEKENQMASLIVPVLRHQHSIEVSGQARPLRIAAVDCAPLFTGAWDALGIIKLPQQGLLETEASIADDYDEALIVTGGRGGSVSMTIAGIALDASVGTCVVVPAGVSRKVYNPLSEEVEIISLRVRRA